MNPGTTTIDFYLFFLCWRLAAYLETLLCQSYMEIMFCFVAADDTFYVFPPTALTPGSGKLTSLYIRSSSFRHVYHYRYEFIVCMTVA